MSIDEVGQHDGDVFQFKMGAVTIVGDPKTSPMPASNLDGTFGATKKR